ncbi:MAG: DUF2182 domain-containing protein [Rhizobiaceae bacterium]
MAPNDQGFDHLDRPGRLVARLAYAPGGIAYGAVFALVAAAWVLLTAMAAALPVLSGGPGARLLSLLPAVDLPPVFDALLALCLEPVSPGAAGFAALAAMWFLMSVAMMLPSAAPLIRTYCEIADTAHAAEKTVAHPLWLVVGYLAVWFVISLVYAGLGMLAGGFAGSTAGLAPAAAPLAVAALAIAGLYQFSGLKQACLVKCRNPFAILFANWSARPAAIFRLGAVQGLWCFGCCWALMLVMFAVGMMNVFWMALLAVFTLFEKSGSPLFLSRLAGAILLVWALAVLLVSG